MICCEDEIWKMIKGFEPFYRISSCGRIQTCKVRGGKKPCVPDRIGPWIRSPRARG